MLTYEKVRELFHYNRKSGKLFRKTSRGGWKKGEEAGYFDASNGYLSTTVDGKNYRVHRLVFLWLYGYLPENDIDHRDRTKLNNRPYNLREASRSCNSRNSKLSKRNTSGIKGVYWSKAAKKWQAYICIGKRNRHLGIFKNFDEAVCYRLAAEQCLDWDGCDSSSPAYKYVRKNIQMR